MDYVRLGIIGIGNMGSAHANSVYNNKIAHLKLTAVCDCSAFAKQWAEENLPDVPFFSDSNAMLDSGLIDAVLIATPHFSHPDLAIAAFARGLHVLTEKPAGVYTVQVEAMCHAAKQSGKTLGIMFNQRTNLIFQKAKEIIESGGIGNPKRLLWNVTNWYRTQYYYDSGDWRATWAGEGGGVLLNQAPHNLDIWQWLFGMPTRIRATCSCGKYHNVEVEDEAHIHAEYANGATADFITSTGECPGSNRLEIIGDGGKILIENGALRFWKLCVSEREFCYSHKKATGCPEMEYVEFRQETPEPAHRAILQNFTNAVLFGEPLLVNGEDGLKSLSLSNAAYLSAWTDDWVTLPIDGDKFYRFLSARIASSAFKPGISGPSGRKGSYSERWRVRW